jgi:hypothetical protein
VDLQVGTNATEEHTVFHPEDEHSMFLRNFSWYLPTKIFSRMLRRIV